jgi:hypothetical protein
VEFLDLESTFGLRDYLLSVAPKNYAPFLLSSVEWLRIDATTLFKATEYRSVPYSSQKLVSVTRACFSGM